MHSSRARSIRTGRCGRRRRESEEETINIDLSRPVAANVVDFLWRCRQPGGCRSRAQKVAYLNALARVLTEHRPQTQPNSSSVKSPLSSAGLPLTSAQLMLCLRSVLVSDTRQVRAAGYRAVRAAIWRQEDVLDALACHIDMLMVRSLELSAAGAGAAGSYSDDCLSESVQVMRLARRMLVTAPHAFPHSVTCSLLAAVDPCHFASSSSVITADVSTCGDARRDRLWMLIVATLCHMCVLAPHTLTHTDNGHALLHAALVCQQARVVDAIVVSLLRLDNTQQRPANHGSLETVHWGVVFNTFSEQCHVNGGVEQAALSSPLSAAQLCVVSLLRCWSGLWRVVCDHRTALTDWLTTLRCRRPAVCWTVVRALFELLDCAVLPPHASAQNSSSTSSGRGADELLADLCGSDASYASLATDACQLYKDFVAAEARLHLPHLAKSCSSSWSYASASSTGRPDLADNYMALLVYTLLDCGALDALVAMVLTSAGAQRSQSDTAMIAGAADLCVAGVVLIVELLERAAILLPAVCAVRQWHSLPHLLSRVVAHPLAVSHLLDLLRVVHTHRQQRRHCIDSGEFSLFFSQQLRFMGAGMACRDTVETTSWDTVCRPAPALPTLSDSASADNCGRLNSVPVTQTVDASVSDCVATCRVLASDCADQWCWTRLQQLARVLAACRPRHHQSQPLSDVATSDPDSGGGGSSRLCSVLRQVCWYARPSSRQLSRRSVGVSTAGRNAVDTRRHVLVISDVLVYLSSVDLSVCVDCCQLFDQVVADLARFLRSFDSLSPLAVTASSRRASTDAPTCEPPPQASSDGAGGGGGAAMLSANALVTSCARYYFLLVGRLLAVKTAHWLLERHGVRAALVNLAHVAGREDLVKLILSSLNFSGGSGDDDQLDCQDSATFEPTGNEDHHRWPWLLLEQCLRSDCEPKRLYSTQHLLLLVRCRCVNFGRWGVDLLLGQLTDSSPRVVAAAVAVTHEMCDLPVYLVAVVRQQPSVFSLGESGVLLLARVAGNPLGFRQLLDGGLLHRELMRWKETFCERYVVLLERLLSDSLSRHQSVAGLISSCSDGSGGGGGGLTAEYGRRSGERARVRPAVLLPHLYGELAAHPAGLQMLQSQNSPLTVMRRLIITTATAEQDNANPIYNCAVAVHRVKAALWAVANVARTQQGAAWLLCPSSVSTACDGSGGGSCDGGDTDNEDRATDLIGAMIRLTCDCRVPHELRATSYLVLGVCGTTDIGATQLASHGWLVAGWTPPQAAQPNTASQQHHLQGVNKLVVECADAEQGSGKATHSPKPCVRDTDSISTCKKSTGHYRTISQLSQVSCSSLVSSSGGSGLHSESLLSCRLDQSAQQQQPRRRSLTSQFGTALRMRLSRGASRSGGAGVTAVKLTPPSSARQLLARTLPVRLGRLRRYSESQHYGQSRPPLWRLVDRLSQQQASFAEPPVPSVATARRDSLRAVFGRDSANSRAFTATNAVRRLSLPRRSVSHSEASSGEVQLDNVSCEGENNGDFGETDASLGQAAVNGARAALAVAVPASLSDLWSNAATRPGNGRVVRQDGGDDSGVAACQPANSQTLDVHNENQQMSGAKNSQAVLIQKGQAGGREEIDEERNITKSDKADVGSSEVDECTSMFQYHSRRRCLRCFSLRESGSPAPEHNSSATSTVAAQPSQLAPSTRTRSITDSSTESSQQQQLPSSAAAAADDSSSSADSCGCSCMWQDGRYVACDAAGHVRRELLRLLGALTTGVAAKPAEQALLALKQRYWRHLRGDICLYSEAHAALGDGRLPKSTRGFVHELFEDAALHEVCEESIELLHACRRDQGLEL